MFSLGCTSALVSYLGVILGECPRNEATFNGHACSKFILFYQCHGHVQIKSLEAPDIWFYVLSTYWWFSELKWGEVRWGKVTWRDVTWRDVTWRDVTWRDVTWRDVTWRDVTWRDVMWLKVSWGEARWGRANLGKAKLCQIDQARKSYWMGRLSTVLLVLTSLDQLENITYLF